MHNEKKSELTINEEVIAKMASIAATEIEGVVSMYDGVPVTVKNILNRVGPLKSVKVDTSDGIINLDVYIKVKENVKARDVAEAVQTNIKDKVQDMTGNAVTKVNVYVADIMMTEEKK